MLRIVLLRSLVVSQQGDRSEACGRSKARARRAFGGAAGRSRLRPPTVCSCPRAAPSPSPTPSCSATPVNRTKPSSRGACGRAHGLRCVARSAPPRWWRAPRASSSSPPTAREELHAGEGAVPVTGADLHGRCSGRSTSPTTSILGLFAARYLGAVRIDPASTGMNLAHACVTQTETSSDGRAKRPRAWCHSGTEFLGGAASVALCRKESLANTTSSATRLGDSAWAKGTISSSRGW